MTTSWHTSEHNTWPIAPARLVVSDGAEIVARATDFNAPVNVMISTTREGRVTVANIGFEPLALEALWQTLSDVRVVLANTRATQALAAGAVADVAVADIIFGSE